jgi:hypothetical protein
MNADKSVAFNRRLSALSAASLTAFFRSLLDAARIHVAGGTSGWPGIRLQSVHRRPYPGMFLGRLKDLIGPKVALPLDSNFPEKHTRPPLPGPREHRFSHFQVTEFDNDDACPNQLFPGLLWTVFSFQVPAPH